MDRLRMLVERLRTEETRVKDDAARRGLLFKPGTGDYSEFVTHSLSDLRHEARRVWRGILREDAEARRN